MTLKSWKTSLFGVLTILSGIFDVFMDYQAGHPPDYAALWPKLSIGAGLLLSKDFNVSGSAAKPTVTQY